MPSKSRPDPVIPDHEILRKIGGGAYGEVWLGRGVTGALRAVKVVWREDFDDARGFEREFEGILKFEPISRDHPGLVHILHVGRSPDGVSFYYYVMELGDDVRAGQDINPIEYEPRTLRADTKQAVNPQLDTATCIDVGLRLAEALDHLHERGLAHRDVKPSNVIFLNGRAKLADIGLVAARDQRTFVGTEGFVPPEGPGSAQADVYSLGKVLYEIATGKDRLDFPELPDALPAGSDRKRWLELNKIICDICEPRLSKRMITTASGLAEALKRLQRGKRRRSSGLAVWMTTLLLTGFAGWAGYQVIQSGAWEFPWQKTTEPDVAKTRFVQVLSWPEGADVFDAQGRKIGTTPTKKIEVHVGDQVRYVIRKSGYRSEAVEKMVPDGPINQAELLPAQLMVFSPPVVGEKWEDHLGNFYQPKGEGHESVGNVTEAAYLTFLKDSSRAKESVEFIQATQDGEPVKIALTSEQDANAFCDWLRVGALKKGYLTEDYEVVPNHNPSFQAPGISAQAKAKKWGPLRVDVRRIKFGMIRLVSTPPGAQVSIDGVVRGLADGSGVIEKVKPGDKVSVLLLLEGYKQKTVEAKVVAGETTFIEAKLEQNKGVVFGKSWENGLKMKFVPLGPDLMVSIYETRNSDYDRFVQATGHAPPRAPEFKQGPDYPVVNVSREDAEAFCQWLTKNERESDEQLIGPSHEYRLPTDTEWSRMAGLDENHNLSPMELNARKPSVFMWGTEWPPDPKAGNFADSSAALMPGMTLERTIHGYSDDYPYTAPVGSFTPNALGIYDLSGNVQEWVHDDFIVSPENPLGILRGGSWKSYEPENLYTGTRNPAPPLFPDDMYGFRIVLSKKKPVDPVQTPLDVPMPAPEPAIPAN